MSRTFVIQGTFFVLAAMLCGSWVEAFSIPANSLSLRSTSFLSRRAPVCSSSQRRKLASSWRALVDVSDADFKDLVLESEVPTLVSFWASWCGPCRMIKPVLEDLESEYDGRLKVVQINTDDNQGTATEYGIRSIPTLILFKGGERVDTIIGAVPKTTLEAKLSQKL
mmetsp:Transcript_43722/g.103295  ORF Transcript_43722/g.103295 Transcript_43722/m.103295 type:complete len:167 (-) Transcript_43722:23-523(-)